MEVCALRDAAPDFKSLNARVFGISTDDVAAQAAFAKAQKLDYLLLADPDAAATKAYGVLMGRRNFARRVTFVVDDKGVIRHVFKRVNVRGHGKQVSDIIKKLSGDTGDTGALDEAAFKELHALKPGAAPKLTGADVKLAGGKAYLSLPKTGTPKAGIIVIHEWWGLNSHVKHWADRLASDGYAALAVDLYGGVVATTRDEAMAAMRGVDEAAGKKVIAAAMEFLARDPRIKATRRASIGWCFGGAWSLRSALDHPELDAAVLYYGRLQTDPSVLKPIKAAVLGVFGNRDRGIPPASVDAFEKGLAAAGVRHRILRYDANHAFANPSSARYDGKAAAAAWKEVRAFLARHLQK